MQSAAKDNSLDVKLAASYDTYDYIAFWKGRDYENISDFIAIRRLFKKIRYRREKIIEIGVGSGRIVPLYQESWPSYALLDPSTVQLEITRRAVKKPERAAFIRGIAQAIPLPDASVDTAISIRVFQYIDQPEKAISEAARILRDGGYFILEIPNKVHFKARVSGWLHPKKHKVAASKEPVSRLVNAKNIIFLNHHPETITVALQSKGFIIEKILSVSNFRYPLFKKIVPLNVLLAAERILQMPLANIWFGPSIYFLARKKAANS